MRDVIWKLIKLIMEKVDLFVQIVCVMIRLQHFIAQIVEIKMNVGNIFTIEDCRVLYKTLYMKGWSRRCNGSV